MADIKTRFQKLIYKIFNEKKKKKTINKNKQKIN